MADVGQAETAEQFRSALAGEMKSLAHTLLRAADFCETGTTDPWTDEQALLAASREAEMLAAQVHGWRQNRDAALAEAWSLARMHDTLPGMTLVSR